MNEQITVALASYPKREEGMIRTVKSLLPQCDRFCLYLNEYTEKPKGLPESDKLIIVFGDGKTNKNYKDYGKFFWFGDFDGYYFTVDDDIEYPSDYCKTLKEGMKRHDNECCGFHGNIFNIVGDNVIGKSRLDYYGIVSNDTKIDCIGTGTGGFYPKKFSFGKKQIYKCWENDEDLDMSVSILIAKEKKYIFSIKRNKNYLRRTKTGYINPLFSIDWAWEKRFMQYHSYLREKNNKKKSNILVISAATENYKFQYNLTNPVKQDYCDAHGYEFLFVLLCMPPDKSYFVRRDLIEKYLNDYDYVMWMDVDAWFNDFSITLESIINEYGNKNTSLWITKEIGSALKPVEWVWSFINSGVLLWRGKKEESKKMVELWKCPTTDMISYKNAVTKLNDQPFLCQRILFDSYYNGKVSYVPFNRFNSFLRSDGLAKPDRFDDACKNNFILHAAGIQNLPNRKNVFVNAVKYSVKKNAEFIKCSSIINMQSVKTAVTSSVNHKKIVKNIEKHSNGTLIKTPSTTDYKRILDSWRPSNYKFLNET